MLTTTTLLVLLLLSQGGPTARPQAAKPPQPTFFTSPYPLDEMRGKQAVMETTLGTVVLQLLPDAAPNHVAFFMTLAREGGYTGTTFHRVVRNGIVQGGDPITKDPARVKEYGSGGMNRLRAESRAEKHTSGAVTAITFPGNDDSAGSQFMICIGDQPAFDGQYTVFARVVEGLEVVQAISAVDADAEGLPRDRIAITNVTIRDTPPEPFVSETIGELASTAAILETTMGDIELQMLPDKAPVTVRRFLQMVAAGVYDGMGVHRVAANFVIQTGALYHRSQPLLASQQRLVTNLPPEFTDTLNEPGVVSMARGDDPGSGSTSFFICIGACSALTGKYTVFARVTGGMDVVKAMAAVPVNGETPVTPILVKRMRTERR
jgi:cyclophilin family peptidyl-prolyl cis-trans isomerase